MFLGNNRNQIYVMLFKSCKFLRNCSCIGLQSQRGYCHLSCFLCDSETEKPRVSMARFLTTFAHDIKGDQSFRLLSLSALFLLPLSLWLTGLFWNEPLYWNAILCRLAAISTSQWCATNLVELSFQRPHLIWNSMPSNFLILINQPKASLALLTPFSSYSSKTRHHSEVCHYSNSLWHFWLCFAHCDYLFFVLA